MRHCYSTGDELLLANNVCKPLLAKQLGCFKIYVFDRKFWLLYWKFQFLLSAGDEHFLNKPENSNSKIGREVGLSCFRSPFSPSVPYPGLVEGEALRGVRTGKKQQLARLQKCCKLGGGARVAVQITAEKGERIANSGASFMMQYIQRRTRSFPVKANAGKKFPRSGKGTLVFMTAGWRTAP